jgi:hypothetical protein
VINIPNPWELGLSDEENKAYEMGVNQGLLAAIQAADKLAEIGHQVDEVTLGMFKQFLAEEV